MTEKEPELELSIGEIANRSGVAISTLHFYEKRGLIKSHRNAANHRQYPRQMLRRIAIIRLAQQAGFSLDDIAKQMAHLPLTQTITTDDWNGLAQEWYDELNYKIALLTELRDKMGSCIGCGCLSVAQCPIYNKKDRLASEPSNTPLLARRLKDRLAP